RVRPPATHEGAAAAAGLDGRLLPDEHRRHRDGGRLVTANERPPGLEAELPLDGAQLPGLRVRHGGPRLLLPEVEPGRDAPVPAVLYRLLLVSPLYGQDPQRHPAYHRAE